MIINWIVLFIKDFWIFIIIAFIVGAIGYVMEGIWIAIFVTLVFLSFGMILHAFLISWPENERLGKDEHY